MRIVTIVGARPQFIKAAVVSRAIEKHNRCGINTIEEIIIHTGQHYDANMSDIFFKEMEIPCPRYNLGVRSVHHGAMTGEMLGKLETILLTERPNILLVYGDTNSTLAGALAAVKLKIPVAHVEAGLRSFNMEMPEEINRILTDRISKWLFCPTETAVLNLNQEGLSNVLSKTEHTAKPLVINVGDVMYDAALYYRKIGSSTSAILTLISKLSTGFYLATIHRAENTDDPVRLSNIVSALDDISKSNPIVLPLHPRTKKRIRDMGIMFTNVHIIDPVGYFDMLSLINSCQGVFTDSGGLQKEAYFFNKPCVTLREETEWVELVQTGNNILVGVDRQKISAGEHWLKRERVVEPTVRNLYGVGDAGDKIVQVLTEAFL